MDTRDVHRMIPETTSRSTKNMPTRQRYCRVCKTQIPAERLEALPGTTMCVSCSAAKGGEKHARITVRSVGKASSLKKTSTETDVVFKHKRMEPDELGGIIRRPEDK